MRSEQLGDFHHQSPARHRNSWRSKNYQKVPGYTDFNQNSRLAKLGLEPLYHICPHYPLIEICAELVGIEPLQLATTVEFCGVRGEYVDTMSFLSGFRGSKYHPTSLCSIIYDQLHVLVTSMQDSTTPQPQNIRETLNSTPDFHDKKRVLDRYIESQDANSKRDQQFLKWQEIIFNNCCIPASAEPNPAFILSSKVLTPEQKVQPVVFVEQPAEDEHFRRITSPQDLSYEEVMSRVSSFLTSLRDQVTGDIDEHNSEITKSRFLTGALHCEQSPEYHEFGMRS